MIVKKIFTRGEDGGPCNFEIECEWEPMLLSDPSNSYAWALQSNNNESPPMEGQMLSTPDFQALRVTECTIEEDFFEDTIFLSTRLITNSATDKLTGDPGLLTVKLSSYQYGTFNIAVKDPTKAFTLVMPDQLIKK